MTAFSFVRMLGHVGLNQRCAIKKIIMSLITLICFIIIAIAILLVLFYTAYKAKPAKNKSGLQINPAPKWHNTKSSITIGTYNIQSGKDVNGKRNIAGAALIIKDCDIVGIQEVYARTWLGIPAQAKQLAKPNQLGWLFAATRRRWFREHRGNALLSKVPVNNWKITMLPDQTGKQFRNLVTAMITLADIEVAVFVTHLHTKKGREEQLAAVIQAFQEHQHAVLLGDFNTRSTDPQLQKLLQDPSVTDALSVTFNTHDHSDRIDWILTKNLDISKGQHEPIGISDHPFYSIKIAPPAAKSSS